MRACACVPACPRLLTPPPASRRWQHVYWPIPYSVLFLYWRFDSIRCVNHIAKTPGLHQHPRRRTHAHASKHAHTPHASERAARASEPRHADTVCSTPHPSPPTPNAVGSRTLIASAPLPRSSTSWAVLCGLPLPTVRSQRPRDESPVAPRRYVLKYKKWSEAARLAVHWAAFASVVPSSVVA